ncbi:MAG: pilus assembly protein PilF, partial [Chloroflexi bacterium]|nr:pilus assembly protein PilF [Chloroflexota bacterium]
FAITTALRAHQFGDELRRTQIEVQHHPNSMRTNNEAANAIVTYLAIPNANSPRYYFARKHYEMAVELDPTFKPGLLGLIYLNCRVKIAVEDAWVDELARRLHEITFAAKDRNILYSIKETSISGMQCLTRNQVEHLFTAAITNTSVTRFTKAILHSWQADYLMLAAHDLLAAESELNKS